MVVHIDMDAFGNEGGTQFTLHFDPSQMTMSKVSGVNVNPDVTAGAGIPAGTVLNINAEQVDNGDLGFIAMFVGYDGQGRLQAGTKRIATITFHAAANKSSFLSGLAVTNGVVVAQTVDTTGMKIEVPGGYTVVDTSNGLELSGNVLTANGEGLLNANVMLTDPEGKSRSIKTTTGGEFSFEGLEAGKAYIVTVYSRRFRFAPVLVQPFDNVAGFELVSSGN
jgi:hypothetical protein